MTKKFVCAYVEEDGFSIIRDDVELMVYGTCEGMYTYYHQDGRMYMKNGDGITVHSEPGLMMTSTMQPLMKMNRLRY